MADFKIKSAVLCDDIRREESGQFIIIGTYGGGFLSPKSLPLSKRSLKCYIGLWAMLPVFTIEYRFIRKGSREALVHGEARLEFGEETPFEPSLVELELGLEPIEFTKYGVHQLQVKIGKLWKEIASINVVERSSS